MIMSKKFSLIYLVLTALFMSAVVGLIIPVINDQVITPIFFGIVFGCSFILTIVFGLILPLHKIDVTFCKMMNQDINSGLGKIFTNTINTSLMMIFLTFVMVGVLTGLGNVDGVNYLTRCVSGYLHIQPIAVIAIIMLDPLIAGITMKLTKEPAPESKAEPAI